MTVAISCAVVSSLICLESYYASKALSPLQSMAHSTQLNIDYDDCVPVPYLNPTNIGDGENEKWYENIKTWESGDIIYQICYHLPHTSYGVSEIKYYVSETDIGNPDFSWTTNLTSTRASYVRNALIDSINKWNNVYFYKRVNNSVIDKKKIINITEGSSSNYNLRISPVYEIPAPPDYPPYATAGALDWTSGNAHWINSLNGIDHYHVDKWDIKFNLFYHNPSESTFNLDVSNFVLSRTGAHELGHVLGLWDIDECESASSGTNNHHEELLMGYSYGNTLTRQSEITYKDLVGAAITRGYHSDNDHQWIYDASSSTSGNYKLICSICNGVKYVTSLNNYTYVNYKFCLDNHSLSSNNMFAVASYNNQDYYKCKYCRYVAPFTDLVNQNYTRNFYNNTQHTVVNNVSGLGYLFYENHSLNSNNDCTLCGGHVHTHQYTDYYEYYSNAKHKAYCECGEYVLRSHAVDSSSIYYSNGHQYGTCVGCGYIIDLGTGGGIIGPLENGMMVSDNGSYILPNGIIVLVEDDIDTYLEGTLVFHLYGEISN